MRAIEAGEAPRKGERAIMLVKLHLEAIENIFSNVRMPLLAMDWRSDIHSRVYYWPSTCDLSNEVSSKQQQNHDSEQRCKDKFQPEGQPVSICTLNGIVSIPGRGTI